MKQITQLIEVMPVGRGGDQAVGQATLASTPPGPSCQSATDCLWSDVSPDRVAALCSGRAGCLNDGGIHQSALVIMTPASGQPAIDGLEQLTGQLMPLEQVAEIHGWWCDPAGRYPGIIGQTGAWRRFRTGASSMAPSLRLYQCRVR